MDYKNLSPKDRIILALDVDTIEEARALVKELKNYIGIFKVGLQLFTSVGPEIFKVIKDEGAEVYFDGKFHDIPSTVSKASSNLIKHGVTLFNLNIQGSSKMITTTVKQAKETAKKLGVEDDLKILGVTLLTSFGQRTLSEELGVNQNIDDYVIKLAEIAKHTELNGVVATAADAQKIRKICGDDFIIVCPAVRPTWSIVNDQVRVVTPSQAILAGCDYIVIGRPITQAKNKVEAAEMIIAEIEDSMTNHIL